MHIVEGERRVPFRRRRAMKVPADPALDPAVRALMELALDCPRDDLDDVVRIWFYRLPIIRSPPIACVRRNLQYIRRDLAVVPYVNDAG